MATPWGLSVTGETPQERDFRDEEAHRTPPGKRPSGTERNGDTLDSHVKRTVLESQFH